MKPNTIPIIQKILSELKVGSFVYTYHYKRPDFGRFNSRATLINWQKITFFGDYDIDSNKLEPLDEEIVDSMRGCEAVVLKMMDRLETLKDYSYRERKELYLKHLRYWNGSFARKKIDLFISSNVPHETSDFVCYCLCKLKKIPTIILCQTHIPDTTLIFNDWENSDYGLNREHKRLRAKYADKGPDEIKLTDRFEKYYALQTSPDENPAPFYMKNRPVINEGVKKIVSISKKLKRNPSAYSGQGEIIARALSRRLNDYFKTKILMNYYESRCARFNPNQKYIFLALHLQPEMSTSPRADAYVDQLLVVQLLSACAPRGIKIFVKEHPNQRAYTRSKDYYRQMLSLPNVRLISRKVDSKILINNSLAVATCVGLAGFEGLFRGKPLLMFGHNFYQLSPGVFPIRTKSDLEHAIQEILRGHTFTPKDFKIFLKALENISINGTIDSVYLPTSKLNNDENASNIARAVIDYAHSLDLK
jgi:hypothetical protein